MPFSIASRRGVALLLALWVLVLLSFVGLETRVRSRADTGGTRTFKEALQTHYLARGGVERGIGLVDEYFGCYPSNPLMAKMRGDSPCPSTTARPSLLGYLEARGVEDVVLGEGTYTVRFEDLSGRLNVNRTDPLLLANLAQQTGLDRSRAEAVADAILDWIDADDLHRPRGAEADSYERAGLPPPRNAPLHQVGELLLVKGVTREVLYGGGRLKGLARFLTTEGSGKINVNTAPPEVLLAIPGFDRSTLVRVLAERQRRHLRSLEDTFGPAAQEAIGRNPLLGMLSFETTEMRIEGVGELPGSPLRSHARASVGILPSGVIVRSWQDDPPGGLPLTPAEAVLPPESG